MLVLSRKRGEAVVIDGNIEVTVLEVHRDRVKLGLRGPIEVPFRREELCPKINGNEPLCHAGCA
jgi:carbon storage regulator